MEGNKLELDGLKEKSIKKLAQALTKYEDALKLVSKEKESNKSHKRLKTRLQLIKKQGFWNVKSETNPINDSQTVVISMDADSGESRWGNKVTFIARCKNNSTDAYISWASYLGSDTRLTTRVGADEAHTYSVSTSTDNEATFIPTPVAFLKMMAKSNKLVAQVTPYSESPITAIFDTTGLENALVPLRETCGW